jgi:nucleotide sugar dehydrogenase
LGHQGNGVTKKVIDYKKLINTNRAPIHITSFESAEIAKISVNTFLTTKISYANMLSNLITETLNAEQSEVFNILRDDSRIGKKFFSPGLGYGGPCLPRDNRALIAFGKTKSISVPLASATDEVNENQPLSISIQIQNFIKDKNKILFLGVTYKAGTNSAEESHALRVINSLRIRADRLVIHDFYYDFGKDSKWSVFDTFASEFLDCSPDAIVCFLNDKRYLKFLETKPEQIIFRAYDLSTGKNS